MDMVTLVITGILIAVIFGWVIPRLMSGLPKPPEKSDKDVSWRGWDEFDGK